MIRIAFAPVYAYPLPAGHRFPMEKYSLLPQQLVYEGTAEESQFYRPQPISEDLLLLAHSATYWQKLQEQTLSEKEVRAIGFPMSPLLVERGRTIAGGTLASAYHALERGIGMNAAGGTHHAYRDRGEGFCVFNDIAIAASVLLARGEVRRIFILDLDVHQGNGTASIFQGSEQVFTFSMHGERNYPLRKEKSHLDIGLQDHTGDSEYLKMLDTHLPPLLDTFQPDILFYQAGVDILDTDRLGRLAVSREGCRRRDTYVFEWCRRHRLPVVVTMGGGYSPKLTDILEAHANTFRAASAVF